MEAVYISHVGAISLKFGLIAEIADVQNFVNKHSGSTMLQNVEIWHFPLTLAVAIITAALPCYRDN